MERNYEPDIFSQNFITAKVIVQIIKVFGQLENQENIKYKL